MRGLFAALLGNWNELSINQRDVACQPARPRARLSRLCAVFLFYASLHCSLLAQAPAVLWTTNIGAQVFGVDKQTNVYAFGDGKAFILDGAGKVQRTNTVGIAEGSQLYHAAQLDPVSGDYYYAGVYPATICTIGLFYATPAFFLAKFNAAGTLIWSRDFGPAGCIRFAGVSDLRIDSNTNIYVGYDWTVSTQKHDPLVAAFDSSGSNIWTSVMPRSQAQAGGGTVRFGRVTPTGGF